LPYFIYPYQVDYDSEGVGSTFPVGIGGGNGEGSSVLPPAENVKTNRLEIKVKRLSSSDFSGVDIEGDFSIEEMTASWTKDNTIYSCHSTADVGPIDAGGS